MTTGYCSPGLDGLVGLVRLSQASSLRNTNNESKQDEPNPLRAGQHLGVIARV